jgi:pseudouridine-5'-phosphate glycosidase
MIVQGQTTSFKAELYQAIHNLTTDTLKIALYTNNATLNADTTAYKNIIEKLNDYVASGQMSAETAGQLKPAAPMGVAAIAGIAVVVVGGLAVYLRGKKKKK